MSLRSVFNISCDDSELVYYHGCRYNSGYGVAHRKSKPYAVKRKMIGQDEQQRNQEQHLSGQTEKDGFPDFSDGLEECG